MFKKNSKNRLKKRFLDLTEISEELTYGLSKIILLGQKQCLIENYIGIIEYEKNKICVNTKDGKVMVLGESLTINEIGEGELIVNGKITALEICGDYNGA